MIEQLRAETDEATGSIRTTRERVSRGAETVEAVLEGLDTIVGAVEDIDDGVSEIDSATSEQAEPVQRTATAIEGDGEFVTVDDIDGSTAVGAD